MYFYSVKYTSETIYFPNRIWLWAPWFKYSVLLFTFTVPQQNFCINNMLCNIVISLKLSDEGLTSKPKAHKQPFHCGKWQEDH